MLCLAWLSQHFPSHLPWWYPSCLAVTPPFRLLLLALRLLLEIVGKCMWESISQKGGLLWINTHVSIICILLVMNACSNLSKMYSRLIFHQISCHLYIIIFKMPLICMINCLRNVSTVHPCSKRENLNDFIVHSYLINQSSRRPGCRPDPAAIHYPKVACQSVQNTRNPMEKDFKNYAIPFQTVQILNPAWILQRHESDEALSPFGLNSDEACLVS